eukprot:jgi/Ulvmu1/4965/UM207_0009.1
MQEEAAIPGLGSHQPSVCLATSQDALAMSIAPRRFNTSCVAELCAKVSMIRSCEHSWPLRDELKASHAQTVAALSTLKSRTRTTNSEKWEVKRAREEGRDLRAQQKEQSKQAKAAEKRARGGHATDEIEVTVDAGITSLKHGKAIIAALDHNEVKFRYTVKDGQLRDWPTIIWRREVAVGSAHELETVQVPYVMLVLTGRQGEELLRSTDRTKKMMRTVCDTFGAVSLSLLFVGLERHLTAKERADYRSAANGQLDPARGFSGRQHMHNLLSLHFWEEGVVYRDCNDAAQAAEHVIGVTAAIAHQPYKGGEDNVAAFTKKRSEALTSVEGSTELSAAQRQVFKAISGAVHIGPLAAQAVTCRYHSLGSIMRDLTGGTRGDFCNEVENLRAGSRRVGPAAVQKLQWLFTCENPEANLPS